MAFFIRHWERIAVLILASCLVLEAFSPSLPIRNDVIRTAPMPWGTVARSTADRIRVRTTNTRLYAKKKRKKNRNKGGSDDDQEANSSNSSNEAPKAAKNDQDSDGPSSVELKDDAGKMEEESTSETELAADKVEAEADEVAAKDDSPTVPTSASQEGTSSKSTDEPSEIVKEETSEASDDGAGTAKPTDSVADDASSNDPSDSAEKETVTTPPSEKKKVVVIGAGWGGLSTAHALAKEENVEVTLIEASPRVGGLVRDGFTTTSGKRPAEAGQHGFWNNYHNIYRLLNNEIPGLTLEQALTDYAEQGQYSPQGLEAVWPIYRDQPVTLPTGLAQAAFTRFLKLPLLDRVTAFPLVLAFSEFDDSAEAWEKYDQISFRDLCVKLGVSKRCYDEAFEPMILTGLFAPGAECSAAAALGMAYFFVLQSQTAFDVQWCRGNIGDVIFTPWVKTLQENGVEIKTSTQVTGFELDDNTQRISHVQVKDASSGEASQIDADNVVLAVGAKALNSFVQYCPELAQFPDLARFANLRGTSVLATRVFLDQNVEIPYTANACWGFDAAVGMTVFDIKGLHGADASTVADAPGSVIEVDYYHANKLLVLSDDEIIAKVKRDLDRILVQSRGATVVDAAVVRLPQGVNWYFPGSYQDMPDTRSSAIDNLYFAGDIVRSRHGSWSQEKAFVTGIEAANAVLGKPSTANILPVAADELHVQFGKRLVSLAKSLLGRGEPWKGPSLVDFFW